MDRISFTIFEPEEKKFHLTPDWIVSGLWVITIFFFWIFDSAFPPHSEFRSVSMGCVFLITMYYLVTSFFKYKPLNGTLTGKIIFENDSIIISEKVFGLKDITELDFRFGDYYGKRSGSGRNFNPKMYQGVNNFVVFTDSEKNAKQVYFQMLTKNSFLTLSPFINEAIKLKKMTLKDGIDLLGIENIPI